jgi:hypothetical protein
MRHGFSVAKSLGKWPTFSQVWLLFCEEKRNPIREVLMKEKLCNMKKSKAYKVGKAIGSWSLFIVLFLAFIGTIMFHKSIKEL